MKTFFTTFVFVLISILLSGQPGTLDPTFNPGSGANNEYVRRIVVQPDGKILVCGAFTQFNGQNKAYLVRLHPDGALDETFNTGTGFDGIITEIALQPDGKIIAVGGFYNFNGAPAKFIVRLNSDGSRDDSFNIGQGPNNGVSRVLLDPSGKIYISGHFDMFNGVVRNRLARLNPSGSVDNTFNPGTGPQGLIYTMMLQPDGKLIIGGNVLSYDDTPVGRIARILSSGALDNSFNTGTGITSNVIGIVCLELQQDGKIIAGGKFDNFNGTTVTNLIRLHADGQLDTQFTPPPTNDQIESVHLLPNGKLIIAGRFTAVGSTARNRIAALNADGTLDTGFNPGTGASFYVNHIARFDQNRVMIGGYFTSYNGTSTGRIARIFVDSVLGTTENDHHVNLADFLWNNNDQILRVNPKTDYNLEINVFDISGRLIHKQAISGVTDIFLTGLKDGVYQCLLYTGRERQMMRFAKF